MIRRLLVAITASSLFVAACSGPEGIEDDLSTGQSGRFGLVAVSYDHDWANAEEDGLLTTTAQFVRYSAMDERDVARLLALPLDLDRDLPPEGSCRVYDLGIAPEAEPHQEEGSVELLEPGNLRVNTEERVIELAPRHFPWLLPFISGVVYGEAQASLTTQVSAVSAASDGGTAVGAFSAAVDSPALPRLVRIGESLPGQDAAAARDRALVVRWEGRAERPDDVLYVELRDTRAKQDLALRCRPHDDGDFEIPRALLVSMNAGGQATLTVARVRQVAFDASGLQHGELRVTVRDTANVLFD